MGARDLYIDEAHTALDIFRFAVFFSLDIVEKAGLSCTKVFMDFSFLGGIIKSSRFSKLKLGIF